MKGRQVAVFLVVVSVMASSSHALQKRGLRRASTRGASRTYSDPEVTINRDRRLPYCSGDDNCDCLGYGKGKGSGKGKGKGYEYINCPTLPISPGTESGGSPPPPVPGSGSTSPPTGSGSTSPPVEPTSIPTEPTMPPSSTSGGGLPSPNDVPSQTPGGAAPTSKPVEPTTPPSPTEPTTPTDGDGTATEPTSKPAGVPGGATEPPANEPSTPPSSTGNGSSTSPPNGIPTGDGSVTPSGDGTSTSPPNGVPTGDGSSTSPPNGVPTGDGSVTPTGDGTSTSPPNGVPTGDGSSTPPPNGVPTGDGTSTSAPNGVPTGDGTSTSAPNGVPSGDGSLTPGSSPPQPTASPAPTISASPSTSSAPTELPYETEETPNGDGFVSSCRVDPPSGRPAPKVLNANYTYVVLVKKGANITQALLDVEYETHKSLARDLLNCMFSRATFRMLQEEVEYTFISSLPQDATSNAACENVPADQDCYVVDGGITVGYLPPQEESVIMDDIGEILVENYDGGIIADGNDDIIALDFIAFADESSGGDGDGDDGSGANGIIADPTDDSSGNSRGTIAGALVASASVVALAVLALLLIRRRRSTTETTFLSHEVLDDKGSLLDEDSAGSEEDSTTVPVISADSTLSTAVMDQDPKHDVKVCGSSMCPACRAEGPVFLPSTPAVNEGMEDLTPERLSSVESDRKYAMSNTVDL
jgi:hypothetical protein